MTILHRIGMMLVMLAISVALGFGINARMNHLKHERDVAVAATAILATEKVAALRNVRVVTRYVDRVSVVKGETQTIIKKVPIYVTAKADAACSISTGFVWLLDDAAKGSTVPRTGNPDALAEGVVLSTVAESVAGNYGTCRETAEQVIGLQDFIRSLPNVVIDTAEGTP